MHQACLLTMDAWYPKNPDTSINLVPAQLLETVARARISNGCCAGQIIIHIAG